MGNKISFDAASFYKAIRGIWFNGETGLYTASEVQQSLFAIEDLFNCQDLRACYIRQELKFLQELCPLLFTDDNGIWPTL